MTVVLTNASIINYSQIHASTLTQSDSLPKKLSLYNMKVLPVNIMAGTSGYSISELS